MKTYNPCFRFHFVVSSIYKEVLWGIVDIVVNPRCLRLRPAFTPEEPSPYLDEGIRENAAELSSQLSAILTSTNAA